MTAGGSAISRRRRPGRRATLVATSILSAALGATSPVAEVTPVVAVSLLPVADSYSVTHDRTLVVPAPGVLGNDIGLLGDERAVLDSGPAHGDLALRSDGGFTYTPDDGYVGSDVFYYHPTGLLVISTPVTITVRNRAPVAADDAYTAVTGVEKVVPAPGVLANDSDADGDSLTVSLVDGGGNGSLDLNADGSFSYKSGGSFTDVFTFTYRAWDGVAWSATATVSIDVGRASPTQTPTPTPASTLIPLPTLPVPLPTLPSVTPAPTPAPSRPPDPSSSPRPSAEPSPPPTTPTRSPVPSSPAGTAATTPGGGTTGGPGGPDDIGGGFGVGKTGDRPIDPVDVSLGAELTGFDALIDFAVPTLVLTVPGLLLVLAVLAQGLVGAVWLPFVRRWLGGFGFGRQRRSDPGTRQRA
jgi:hypothetical protein